ncbi:MAG: hypothetical protein J2P36_32260 [Ktedonobacteraceae bacterium]|nr:hypothetical protein [Ktedonobacteraceae bacterium]
MANPYVQQAMPPQEQVPQDIYQQAGTYQLGELRRVYKPTFTNPLVVLGLTLGAIILDIAVMVGILVASGYIFYILIAIPILAIIWCGWALPHCGTRAYVFAYGLIYSKGSQVIPMRWEHIQAVQHKIAQSSYRTSHTYTLQLTNGQSLKLPSALKEVVDLGTIVDNEVARTQLPQAMQAFSAGQPINFGRLTIDRNGINNGKDFFPWQQIDRVAIKDQYVVAEKQGIVLKLSVKAEDVPNFSLLDSMVNHITQR